LEEERWLPEQPSSQETPLLSKGHRKCSYCRAQSCRCWESRAPFLSPQTLSSAPLCKSLLQRVWRSLSRSGFSTAKEEETHVRKSTSYQSCTHMGGHQNAAWVFDMVGHFRQVGLARLGGPQDHLWKTGQEQEGKLALKGITISRA
jgi:hypothetical protein